MTTVQQAYRPQLSQWYDYDLSQLIHVPETAGLYAIIRLDDLGGKLRNTFWIYIGKDQENIRSRLFEHYGGNSHKADCIASHYPTHFAFLQMGPGPDLDALEAASIKAYQPACNDQHT